MKYGYLIGVLATLFGLILLFSSNQPENQPPTEIQKSGEAVVVTEPLRVPGEVKASLPQEETPQSKAEPYIPEDLKDYYAELKALREEQELLENAEVLTDDYELGPGSVEGDGEAS